MRTIFPCWDKGKKSYTRGGKVQCDVCGSFKGAYTRNYLRKDREGKQYFKLFKRCANCGSLEVTNNTKGGILRQEKRTDKQLVGLTSITLKKEWQVVCNGKVISKHISFYHAQENIPKLYKENRIDNSYEIEKIKGGKI